MLQSSGLIILSRFSAMSCVESIVNRILGNGGQISCSAV